MTTDVGGIAAEQLKSFVERIERLDEEIAGLNDDKSEIFKEAKSTGFDVKALRLVLGERRKISKDKVGFEEQRAIADLYREALGMTE